jgi:hypothetical protein
VSSAPPRAIERRTASGSGRGGLRMVDVGEGWREQNLGLLEKRMRKMLRRRNIFLYLFSGLACSCFVAFFLLSWFAAAAGMKKKKSKVDKR